MTTTSTVKKKEKKFIKKTTLILQRESNFKKIINIIFLTFFYFERGNEFRVAPLGDDTDLLGARGAAARPKDSTRWGGSSPANIRKAATQSQIGLCSTEARAEWRGAKARNANVNVEYSQKCEPSARTCRTRPRTSRPEFLWLPPPRASCTTACPWPPSPLGRHWASQVSTL